MRPIGLEFTALTGATFHDRLRIAELVARRGGRVLRRAALVPRSIAAIGARTPDRLLIAPQDLRTSDPTTAADIAAGYFAFAGNVVDAMGRSPFALDAEPDVWVRQLAGFGWLRHLRAADSAAARTRARVLVEEFLTLHAKPSSRQTWAPPVTARRALSWLSQSPLILDGADRAFYMRFLQALVRHRDVLARRLAGELAGTDRLLVALALAALGLCLDGGGGAQRRGADALGAEIEAQMLPDGGHVSRNPQLLIDLLLDLLPLRQAFLARGQQPPVAMLNAIDRMIPLLRLFRHGDGSLALFNGMGQTAPELVATILAYDDARTQPLMNARQSGYQRVEAGPALLLVEAGSTPAPVFSTQAHAGCLSFEFSSGPQRIIVNCGSAPGSRASTQAAARTTAAHSTLTIDDASSCRFATGSRLQRWLGDQILAGPKVVTVARDTSPAGTVLLLSHDGYARRFGLTHHRRLHLDADGRRLEGVDGLALAAKRRAGDHTWTLRFHLHPSVKARASTDGTTVRLELPSGEAWLFKADADLFVERSILFAAPGGPRPTSQIRATARIGGASELHWSLAQISAAQPR